MTCLLASLTVTQRPVFSAIVRAILRAALSSGHAMMISLLGASLSTWVGSNWRRFIGTPAFKRCSLNMHLWPFQFRETGHNRLPAAKAPLGGWTLS